MTCTRPGSGTRIGAADFLREVVRRDGETPRLLLRSTNAYLAVLAYVAACNADHSVAVFMNAEDSLRRPLNGFSSLPEGGGGRRMVDTTAFKEMEEKLVVFRARIRGLGESLEALKATRRTALGRRVQLGSSPRPLLTERELEILRLIAEGRDNEEIATALHFALGTIKLHVRGILEKLEARSRTAAAVRAVRLGLI
jgi:DNA-binding CsgD family transcriptional regulator